MVGCNWEACECVIVYNSSKKKEGAMIQTTKFFANVYQKYESVF